MKKKHCIICDIDGVYVDSREWHKYAPEKHDDREGWDEFGKHIDVCKPNKPFILALTYLNKLLPIVFLTSREATPHVKEETINQIEKFSNHKILVSKNRLYMRANEDYRDSATVKEEILLRKILPEFAPLLAIDDELNNINMFKKNNIETLHYTKYRK